MSLPQLIVLFSGKRKCGKDYLTEKIVEIIGKDKVELIRISEPIKNHYAKVNKLDFDELMRDSSYKENYRKEMIKWSVQEREKDPTCFCRDAVKNAQKKTVWIVTDIRRETDMEYFKSTFGPLIKTVRIHANANVRVERGWKFTKGVDDVTSECDLDEYTPWDLEVQNNNGIDYEDSLNNILKLIKTNISC